MVFAFVAVLAGFFAVPSLAFDMSRADNIALYWGQNSYGATHTNDQSNWQQRLSFYCGDNSIDTFPLAFLEFNEVGGVPEMDLANICNINDNSVFSGTLLPNCQFMAADIQACQAAGKIVTLSMGGATSGPGFTSDAAAQAFADQVWNLFLGGTSSTRPFGAAVLDGVDLDIEGGSSNGLAALVTRLRSHFAGASKQYYITGAPQCPFPDAYLGSVINAVGFDALYVQFYNNYCGVNSYGNPNAWDFAQWDSWAQTTSPNKNVKVYLGVPAAPTAANSGYVDASTLSSIAKTLKATYSSFGGVMMWDVSQAYANGHYHATIKSALTGGANPPPPSSTKTSTTTTSTSTKPTTTSSPTSTKPTTTSTKTTTTSVSSGSCAGVAAWSASATYTGGQQAVYGGYLWTAQWWTYGDIPGGAAGVWTKGAACPSAAAAKGVTLAAATTTKTEVGAKSTPAASTPKKSSRFFRDLA